MGLKSYHVICFLRQLTFIAVIYTLTIQPTISALEFHNKMDYELVDIDWEEDTNEGELEDDDKKVKFHFSCEYYSSSYKFANYKNSNLMCKFNQDILIPPPKKA